MNAKRILIPKEGKAICEEFDYRGIENDDQIGIRTDYSVISAGTELAIRWGTESWAKLPYVPGYGSAATVLQVGKNIEGVEVGQRLLCYGPHASHANIAGMFFPVPDTIDFSSVPLLRMAAVSITAPRVSNAEYGDLVAVVGVGLVGNIAAQIFNAMGCRVIAIDPSQNRRDKAKELGIKYALQPSARLKQEIEETCNALPSTVVDASGIPRVIAQSIELVAQNGEMILLGTPRAEFQSDLQPFLSKVHIAKFNVQLKGAHEWIYPRQHLEGKHSIPRNIESIIRSIEDGKVNLRNLISHRIGPGDIQAAYDGLENNPDEYLGVVIDWTR